MKKKSIAARLGIAAMALTLITTSLSSGTLAKYTTEYKATTTLTVAKWNPGAKILKADGTSVWTDFATSTVTGLKLSDTSHQVKAGTVKSGQLAPGMSGEFTVDVSSAGKNHDAVSGVAMTAQIYINKSGTTPNNFTMKTKGGSALTFTGSKDDETLGWKLGEAIELKADTTDYKTVTVEWEWPYETAGGGQNDVRDTTTGSQGGDATYTIAIVFTQANPEVSSMET